MRSRFGESVAMLVTRSVLLGGEVDAQQRRAQGKQNRRAHDQRQQQRAVASRVCGACFIAYSPEDFTRPRRTASSVAAAREFTCSFW